MDSRARYSEIRRGYRLARRADGEWFKAQCYDTRNLPSPQHAREYCRQFSIELVATFFRPITFGSYRLPRGPRANLQFNTRPLNGRFARMNLTQRVAMRAALKQIEAYEAQRALVTTPTDQLQHAA